MQQRNAEIESLFMFHNWTALDHSLEPAQLNFIRSLNRISSFREKYATPGDGRLSAAILGDQYDPKGAIVAGL